MTPKILVCNVACWNSKIGANTFSSLLEKYPAENIANIYCREEFPDNPQCGRYFQIAESRVIRSIYKPGIKTGRPLQACQQMDDQDQDAIEKSRTLYNKNKKKRSYLKLFARELIWKIGKWKSPELDAFIDEFQPDIVLFGMDGYIHMNCICRYVVKRSGAKAVGYFWDDNFTYKQRPGKPGFLLMRWMNRKSLKKLVHCGDAFWAITEKTKREADEFFGIDCQVLTKPIDFAQGQIWKPYDLQIPIKMLYTGNLLIGRFDTVKAVAKAMETVNRDGVKIELDVYTGSYIPPEELEQLPPCVHMKGVVPQQQVFQLQQQADILLFAEAMTGENSKIARLSFSTKLTDYFRSGKCILAIGAHDVAPMEYLRAENAAVCAATQKQITEQLQLLTQDPDRILEMAENAYLCGQRNHSREKIQKIIDLTFEKILGP